MRRRYIARPARFWWDDHPALDDGSRPLLPHLSVYEPDDSPRPTGLLDQHGNELVAISDREPIGFVTFRDRE